MKHDREILYKICYLSQTICYLRYFIQLLDICIGREASVPRKKEGENRRSLTTSKKLKINIFQVYCLRMFTFLYKTNILLARGLVCSIFKFIWNFLYVNYLNKTWLERVPMVGSINYFFMSKRVQIPKSEDMFRKVDSQTKL